MNRRLFLALPLGLAGKRLLNELERVPAIDTHEHIIPETERTSQQVTFQTLAGHYINNDLISAGMAADFSNFDRYWKYARFTGYGEALRIAMRDIYGVEEIHGGVLSKLNEAIAAKNRPGLYRDILKKRAGLRFCINDQYWEPDPQRLDGDLFVLAQKFDGFVMPMTRAGVERLEKLADASITSLDGLKKALAKHFEKAVAAGMVTVKSTAAYQRTLRFDEVPGDDAQREFERLMREEVKPPEGFRALESRPYKPLADHMFHHLVQLADAHRVPFQIHTGLHAGNGNYVSNSHPELLTNLFHLYPRVKFDLFHIGYPYQHSTAVLAKLFPNVYVDFCWMHIVSPAAARAALDEMLDAVPANKIFGFGGDYRYPELSYAHLVMARRNIAAVLEGRVHAGTMREAEAVEVGRWLLHDNPAALFAPTVKSR